MLRAHGCRQDRNATIFGFLTEDCHQEPVWSGQAGVGSAELSQFGTVNYQHDFRLSNQPRRHLRQMEDPSPEHCRWSELDQAHFFQEISFSLELHEVSNVKKRRRYAHLRHLRSRSPRTVATT